MQDVFENIVTEIERRKVGIADNSEGKWFKTGLDIGISIIKDVAVEYNNGWIPCSERLPEITEEQALSECVPDDSDYPISKVYCPRCRGEGLIGAVSSNLGYMEVDCPDCDTAIKRFKNLWNSTIKKSDLDIYGWDVNPWVWVIEFERCKKPEVGE